MDRRKKSRASSDHRFIVKLGQSQGYKHISRETNVPVSTVQNAIKMFEANSTGHKRNLRERKGWF